MTGDRLNCPFCNFHVWRGESERKEHMASEQVLADHIVLTHPDLRESMQEPMSTFEKPVEKP